MALKAGAEGGGNTKRGTVLKSVTVKPVGPIQYTAGKAYQQSVKKPVTAAPKTTPAARAWSNVVSTPAAAPAPAPVYPTVPQAAVPQTTTLTGNPYGPLQQTEDALMPFWERARANMKSNLADQGMLSSTGGWRRYDQEVEQPYAKAANVMYADLQKQARDEQYRATQSNVQNAQNLYNLLWSQYFNSWQLKGNDQGLRAPQDFPLFSNMASAQYQQPLQSYLPQNMGDANTEQVPRYSPNNGDTLDSKNAAASQAYQSAYLELAQQQAARDNKASDPWTQMASDVVTNQLMGKTTPGQNAYPTDLFESFKAAYDIDLEAEVRAGNPRAEALIRSAYTDPTYADAVIARIKGEDVPKAATPFTEKPTLASGLTNLWETLSRGKGFNEVQPGDVGSWDDIKSRLFHVKGLHI